mmetsp:Transcript_18815/g.46707  ORF Transcript_18815/g.46707 Transcript_18815/m.46707 type:complete len:203 (+) Transcript_18815:474-1082(+)
MDVVASRNSVGVPSFTGWSPAMRVWALSCSSSLSPFWGRSSISAIPTVSYRDFWAWTPVCCPEARQYGCSMVSDGLPFSLGWVSTVPSSCAQMDATSIVPFPISDLRRRRTQKLQLQRVILIFTIDSTAILHTTATTTMDTIIRQIALPLPRQGFIAVPDAGITTATTAMVTMTTITRRTTTTIQWEETMVAAAAAAAASKL